MSNPTAGNSALIQRTLARKLKLNCNFHSRHNDRKCKDKRTVSHYSSTIFGQQKVCRNDNHKIWIDREKRALNISCHSCPICQSHFNEDKTQIILSCSHVFHKACISSFERYIGEAKRFCPLCRFKLYDKRWTTIGTVASKRVAATLIASQWRGWKARKKFRNKLRHLYKKNGSSKCSLLRRKFYFKELKHIRGRIEKEVKTKEETVDSLLCTLSRTIQESRQAFEELSSRKMKSSSHNHWDIILRTALEREGSGKADCAVCFNQMMIGSGNSCNVIDSIGKQQSNSKLTILSCSHVFHSKCIESLENFNFMSSSEAQPVCPVCRLPYDKLDIVF